MQLGLVSAAPHPPPKKRPPSPMQTGSTLLIQNTLTFLGKERDYSTHFAVFVRIFEEVFGAAGTCSETFQPGNLRISSPTSSDSYSLRLNHRAQAWGDCK